MFDAFQSIVDSIAGAGPTALFFVILLGTFISEDGACLLAGAAVSTGRVGFAAALLACFAGIFAGDLLIYLIGRSLGSRLLATEIARHFVSANSIDKARKWLERNGPSVVFTSRFATGLRLPTYLAAGTLRTDLVRFLIYVALAAAAWTPLIVGVPAYFGASLSVGSILAILGGFIVCRFALRLFKWKDRRLLSGKIRRLLRWEFWPLAVFYFPVVCYVLILAIRHRGLTIFTAANPGISSGGFVGESKDSIYSLIDRSKAASPHLLKHKLISGELNMSERLGAARGFIQQNNLSFPIVLKPNVGERGRGVKIVSGVRTLKAYLEKQKGDVIIQEYFDGIEASIFYYRFPDESNGHIFSITEKIFPAVTGDGRATVEELILGDGRAVCLARRYFEQLADRLSYVPTVGEQVRLIDIGTHSRGAVFKDGGWMSSNLLEKMIDEICRGIDGFCFGRFDIRARSFDDLCEGRKFKIIELNGVSSESTNIYDARYTLLDAYRILFSQWKLAFEIGAANNKAGARPMSLRALLKLIFFRKRYSMKRQVSHEASAVELCA